MSGSCARSARCRVCSPWARPGHIATNRQSQVSTMRSTNARTFAESRRLDGTNFSGRTAQKVRSWPLCGAPWRPAGPRRGTRGTTQGRSSPRGAAPIPAGSTSGDGRRSPLQSAISIPTNSNAYPPRQGPTQAASRSRVHGPQAITSQRRRRGATPEASPQGWPQPSTASAPHSPPPWSPPRMIRDPELDAHMERIGTLRPVWLGLS